MKGREGRGGEREGVGERNWRVGRDGVHRGSEGRG